MTRRVEKVGTRRLTNSSVADVAVVWAKLDCEIRAHRHALGRHRAVFARQLV
jgi:hypothetical protein